MSTDRVQKSEQQSAIGCVRWGCKCCTPHSDDQRRMHRRTRRNERQRLQVALSKAEKERDE